MTTAKEKCLICEREASSVSGKTSLKRRISSNTTTQQ